MRFVNCPTHKVVTTITVGFRIKEPRGNELLLWYKVLCALDQAHVYEPHN